MKKVLLIIAVIVSAIIFLVMLGGTSIRKLIVVNRPDRIAELVSWVDKKSVSGELMKEKDGLGSFFFVGDHEIDIDFDRSRYGLEEGAVAKVVVDADHKPLSVVFIDGSYCAIAVALHAGKSIEETFGDMPSDLRLSSPRVGTFCVQRD